MIIKDALFIHDVCAQHSFSIDMCVISTTALAMRQPNLHFLPSKPTFTHVYSIFLFFIAGEIFLLRPLDEISAITHVGDPVLLTVIAEEVKVSRDEPPAMASTVQLAFFLPERSNSAPYFENDQYVSYV